MPTKLKTTDWECNLELCDYINSACSTLESCSPVVLAMKQKLTAQKSAAVVLLALILLETCIKNCAGAFITSIAQPPFMRVLEDLAVGVKGNGSKCKSREA